MNTPGEERRESVGAALPLAPASVAAAAVASLTQRNQPCSLFNLLLLLLYCFCTALPQCSQQTWQQETKALALLIRVVPGLPLPALNQKRVTGSSSPWLGDIASTSVHRCSQRQAHTHTHHSRLQSGPCTVAYEPGKKLLEDQSTLLLGTASSPDATSSWLRMRVPGLAPSLPASSQWRPDASAQARAFFRHIKALTTGFPFKLLFHFPLHLLLQQRSRWWRLCRQPNRRE